MNQTEVESVETEGGVLGSGPEFEKGFVYICENLRELRRAALWEGLPASSPQPARLHLGYDTNHINLQITIGKTMLII